MPDDDLQEKLNAIRKKQAETHTQKKAAQASVPYISLKNFPVAQEAVALIPREEAERLRIFSFYFDGDDLRIATTQPEHEEVKQYVAELAKAKTAHVTMHLISEEGLKNALTTYDRLPKIQKVTSGVEITKESLEAFKGILSSFDKMQEKVTSLKMTELVEMIVAAGLESGASDIHLEAGEKNGVVRLRIDGVLHEVLRIPKEILPKLTDRFKLVAKVKINIKDKPQDGRFTITLEEGKTEIRFSTLPTAYGESVVMRILRPGAISLKFEDLGLMGKSFTRLKEQIERPNGMIITTGPTGSGKTTTLYAILQHLNDEQTKIITLENPIEYKLEGIAQSGVDSEHGYSFSQGLRSILRQDPDVVMVGEIRDLETADVAIQAALTGHLMLSTIHTNSAAGAIPRFLSMGVKPFLLPPALNAVIGQRLLRRLCKDCKVEVQLDPQVKEKVDKILAKMPNDHGYEIDLTTQTFYGAGTGECQTCLGMHYKGRVGIYEVFLMNKEIAAEVETGSMSEYKMQELAQQHGMVTMAQDGLIKALMGLTSIEEVFAVAEQKDVEEEVQPNQNPEKSTSEQPTPESAQAPQQPSEQPTTEDPSDSPKSAPQTPPQQTEGE